jgi:decaprenylphospho-beta-D-ribofuranose 2-oxidase
MTTLSGWGRFPLFDTEVITPRTAGDAQRTIASGEGLIPRGNGRAYGDAAIGANTTLDLTLLNRFRAFDPVSGLLTVEPGVQIGDIITALAPRGFFPAVVPGTRYVTVGGAIAADVHGKNHHRDGGFGDCVDSLVLATGDGAIHSVSRDRHPDLFAATIGGMGLTGAILEATLRLRRIETAWLRQRTMVARDLAAAVAALDESDEATYSVAWIDGLARGDQLGRSLIFVGEHAKRDELTEAAAGRPFPALAEPRLGMPIEAPSIMLNRWTVRAFNEAYFRLGKRKADGPGLVPVGTFFFPLDGVDAWNLVYGRRGFVQHQCVLPTSTALATLAEMLDRIAARGDASFLAVLKKLGPGGGIISFPLPGYTLALDFPMSGGLLAFLDELDRLVVESGGRLYLAKDARQSRATFEAGYPDLPRFNDVRRAVDPDGRIRSQLSERLGL